MIKKYDLAKMLNAHCEATDFHKWFIQSMEEGRFDKDYVSRWRLFSEDKNKKD